MTDVATSFPTRWNLAHLCPGGPAEIEAAFERDEQLIANFVAKWDRTDEVINEQTGEKKPRTDYLESPDVLAGALAEYEVIEGEYGAPVIAALLWQQVDQENEEMRALVERLMGRHVQAINSYQFFELRLAGLPKDGQEKILQDSRFNASRNFLKKIFDRASHNLSEPEEQILNRMGEIGQRWPKMREQFLATEKLEVWNEQGRRETTSLGALTSGYIKSPNPVVRSAAGEVIAEVFMRHGSVAAHELNAYLHQRLHIDDLRGFTRPDGERHLLEQVQSEHVDLLLEVVEKNNELARRYYRLKAQLLKETMLPYAWRAAPYGTFTTKYPFPEAVAWVKRVLDPYTPMYSQTLDQMLAEGRIDVDSRPGKVGGAFSSQTTHRKMGYLLLNHTGDPPSVLTLAHELGHGAHDDQIRPHQNALHYHVPVTIAEVSSITAESLMLDAMQREVAEEELLALYMMQLDNDVAATFRQVALYRVEQRLHEEFRKKRALSKEEITGIFVEKMSGYLGEVFDAENDQYLHLDWVGWPHLRANFYVSSYAAGMIIAKAIVKKVRDRELSMDEVAERILRAGSSLPPAELFERVGIDFGSRDFWLAGVHEISARVNQAEDLAKRLGKLPS